VNLLFQVDNEDFKRDIMIKPYLKYRYNPLTTEPKRVSREAFLTAINGSQKDHLYLLNPAGNRGYCFFCSKKSNKESLKNQKEPEKNY
jgi:hypothetical protein